MTFGTQGWGCDKATSIEITRKYLESGGNFIDTADMYSGGRSEEFLGEAIAGVPRDDLVIATKCWFRVGKSPNAKGLSVKHIREAVEHSLRRLKTDFIDLYQLHGPDPHTPLEITLRAMDDLVRAGKVRYVGCSNFYAWQLVKANQIAERNAWSKLVSAQHLYNLLRRDVEREILPACEDQGLGMLCWSPLASGLLTGKYDPSNSPEPESRIGLRADIDIPRYWNDSSFRIIKEVQAMAAEVEKTPAQVALAWLLHDPRVSSVIVGVRTVNQLDASLVVGEWGIPQAVRDRLTQVVPFLLGYPHDWIETTHSNTIGHEAGEQSRQQS
jgi:aryl-alcohol dehydrogenase-like predicted oxidoreductase